MKKLITLLLVLCGGISQASATDYYVGSSITEPWSIQGQMTDTDGDGTYSLIVDLPTKNIYFTLFTANEVNWSSEIVLRPSSSNPWITNTVHEIGMLEPGDAGYTDNGSICYPTTDTNDDKKNYARAIRIEYTPSSRTLNVIRLIAVASGYTGWSTSSAYIEETSYGSKIYSGNVTLEADTEGQDDGFKFVYINSYYEGETLKSNMDYGANSGGNLSNSASNYDVTADGVYTLTANFNTWAWTDPTLVTVPASVGTYGKATLCSEYALDFSDFSGEDAAVKAYRITGAADGVLTPTRVTGRVKAGTGLYIEGAANASINVPTTIETSAPGTNFLKGVTENTNIVQSPAAGVNNYILTVNTQSGTADKPRFYLVNGASGNTVKAGKAYLQITSGGGARDFYWFAEDVTAIDAVKQEQKVDGEAYNLAGQRVSKPSKGLYIVNGKKVIIK